MSAITPTGVIEKLPGSNSSLPTGYAICNGQDLPKTSYMQLFNIIGTLYGTPADTTLFRLPDLRGEFIRGLDNGRGVDSGRTLGSNQTDSFQSHTHTYIEYGGANIADHGGGSHPSGISNTNTGAYGGNETIPINQTIIYIIKL